jgi:uncharacterized protein (TIGR02569 family)
MPARVSKIAAAFGLSGEPERLHGGQGTSYRVGNGVIKPVANPAEAEQIAEIFLGVEGEGFVLPRPLRAWSDWIVDGWSAWEWIPGRHEPGRWEEKIAACDAFHRAIAHVPCPGFVGGRDNGWEEADRMAFGEDPLECHPIMQDLVERLARMCKPVEQPSQLIHGDFTGNVLFSPGQPPAVIDFSLYWRPALFAVGIIISDAIVWEGADASILSLVEDRPGIKPMVARAELRRLLEIDRHVRRGASSLDDVVAHRPFIDLLEQWHP